MKASARAALAASVETELAIAEAAELAASPPKGRRAALQQQRANAASPEPPLPAAAAFTAEEAETWEFELAERRSAAICRRCGSDAVSCSLRGMPYVICKHFIVCAP